MPKYAIDKTSLVRQQEEKGGYFNTEISKIRHDSILQYYGAWISDGHAHTEFAGKVVFYLYHFYLTPCKKIKFLWQTDNPCIISPVLSPQRAISPAFYYINLTLGGQLQPRRSYCLSEETYHKHQGKENLLLFDE